MKIVLPYPPTMNMYWRNVAFGGKPRTLISAEGRAYKARVGLEALKAGLNPAAGEVSMILVAYRPRKIGDLDNLLKPILDALKGYAFEDDSQVVEIHAVRRDDKERPRVEVQILGATP